MKTIRFLLILMVAVIVLPSCKEDEIETFGSSTDIYFSYIDNRGGTPVDSTVIYMRSAEDSLVSIPVKVLGKKADYDRIINVAIVDEDYTTAAARVNGEGDVEFVRAFVPAGSTVGSVQLRLYRTDKLVSKEDAGGLRFKLQLFPSEDFTTDQYQMMTSGSNNMKDGDGNMRFNALIYKVVFTSKQISPMWMQNGDWKKEADGFVVSTRSLFMDTFGEFGTKKAQLMCSVLGKPESFLYPNVEGENREYGSPRRYYEAVCEPWDSRGNQPVYQPYAWYWMRLFNTEVRRINNLPDEPEYAEIKASLVESDGTIVRSVDGNYL